MIRRDTRSGSESATSRFPAIGDYAEVVNSSGQLSPYTMEVERPDIPEAAPRPRPGRRAARMIDAQSGQQLGDETEHATAYAANKASIKRTIDRACPMGQREEEYLRTVLGAPRSARA